MIKYPKSCCGFEPDNPAECQATMKEFHMDGCTAKFKKMIEDNASLIIGASVTIGLLQILGVIFSCLLIRKIRSSAGYEPQFNNYG